MSHTIHDEIETHGLADDCERCEEHAQHPLRTLDTPNLRALMERVEQKQEGRSENEKTAMANVRAAMDQAGVLADVHPILFTRYIRQTWGVRLVAVLGEAEQEG